MTLTARLASLPPPLRIPDARRSLRDALLTARATVVVLDDDPTGTQTVHDVPVLMSWPVARLESALEGPGPLFYVSTNSRALPAAEASALATDIGRALSEASRRTGRKVLAASRSDSTLRGHFPGEVEALAAALPAPIDAVLLVPAFFDAGRYTIDNVHWVETAGQLVPAHRTEFARDPTFGYAHGDLREWVQEKTNGRRRAEEVACLSLEDIRAGGPERVSRLLGGLSGAAPVVVNAACDEDLEVVALGASAAEAAGKNLLYRTSASFVKVRAGVTDRPLLSRQEMGPLSPVGLVVAGSYVERTTSQIRRLLDSDRVRPVEIRVERLATAAARAEEVRRSAEAAGEAISTGHTALLFTSRQRFDSTDFLAAGRRIMEGVCEIVRRIPPRPGFLLAKGGITSVAVARDALECDEALVLGQILRGVPVWRLGAGSKWSDIPYIVFPGNVGDDSSPLRAVEILQEKETS